MNKYLPFLLLILAGCSPRPAITLSKADYSKDVLLQTSKGDIRLHLKLHGQVAFPQSSC